MRVLVGGTALIFGLVFYMTARSSDQLYIIGSCVNPVVFSSAFHGPLAIFADSFPAFIHVFAFSLLTAALLPISRRGAFIICGSWCLVNCLFELGQRYKELSSSVVPNFFQDIPLFGLTQSFFKRGTFDLFDIAAFTLGATFAFLFLLQTNDNQKRKIQ